MTVAPPTVGFAEGTLARQLEWISRADNKASFVIGLETAMVGVLAAAATPSKTYRRQRM